MLNRHKHLLLALLVACIAAWPLLSEPGLLNTRGGGDSPFLLQRVHQLEVALRAGHFPVRWMPDANYGYGYPFYNYYAPLSIYIAVAFRFLGFSIVRAIHLAQLAGFLVAAWGMFRLAYGWWRDENIALVASVAYTVAPFHLVNVYVRGDSLAEFWAMAFYPLILLAVDRLFDRQDIPIPQRIIPLGLAYAALIISHNISALIFSPFLLLYILLRARNLIPSLQRTPSDKRHSEESSTRNLTHSKGIRSFTPQAPFGVTGERISLLTIGHAIVGLLLAFALSAWFFVPALAEQSLAQLGPVTEGYFHYSNHFRGLDLVQTSWLFDYSVSGGGAFRMGLVQGITAVIGLILLIIHRQQNPTTILFTTLTFAIATFMITPTSELLWDYLPLLPLTQFPWRFLSVQAFGAALATAGLAKLPWGRLGAWGAVGITAVLTIASLATLETDHLILTDADITAEKLVQYEWFTGNIGTTVSAEYLPHNVIPRPYTSGWLLHGDRDHVVALDGDAAVTLVERRATEQTWSVQTDDAAQLIFPTLYWPGWEVWVDGERVESRAASGNGLFLVDVPAGAQEVVLRLARTPVRLVAELVSLTAVFLVLFLGFYPIIKSRKGAKTQRKEKFRALVLMSIIYFGAVILLLALLAQIENQKPLPNSDLTWDFAQMGYLHHDVAGVAFDNGAVLQGYSYDDDKVGVGEELHVIVEVDEAENKAVTLSLLTPAHLWPAIQERSAPPPLVSSTQTVRDGVASFTLRLPENAPSGLYVPQLVVEDGQPLLPSGKTRGDLLLRPLRIVAELDNNLGSLQVEGIGGDLIGLEELTGLRTQLQWGTERPLTQNLNTSLRLLDASGQELAVFDTQPGYGFLPSSLWPVGERVNDWLTLPLSNPLGGTPPYALVTRLYNVETGEIVLTRRVGELSAAGDFMPHVPQFEQPDGLESQAIAGPTAVFQRESQPLVQLLGYHLDQTETHLTLTLAWETLAPIPEDYTRFVHLLDAPEQLVVQNDSFPLGNSYPTSQWITGEIVVEKVVFPVDNMGEIVEKVAIGFYLNDGVAFPRLTAVLPDGTLLPNNAVVIGR